jgi:PAS domain S-box-containing protein
MHWLRRGGFEPIVERVDTIAALRTALAGQKWDIIISDYYIPPFNGLEALALWKESGLNIPFIVVSGTMGEDVAVECMKAGAIDYLMKDRLARLGSAVTRALEQEKLLEEKRLAEQEIESLAKFPSEDISPVLRFARDGRLLYANPASVDLLRTWDCEVGDRPPHEIQLIVYQSLVIPMSQEIEVAHGDTIDALMFLPIVDKDYVNVYGRDITERKRAEEALQNREKRFRALIENNNDVIAIFDLQATILYVSTSLTRTFGYLPNELLGTRLAEYVHPEDQASLGSHWSKLLKEPENAIRMEFHVRHRNGSWRWAEATAQNRLFEPSVHGIIVNFRDVTERKQAEEKIERQLQHLSTLRAIDVAISSSFDMRVTLDIVLQQVRAQLGVDAAAILLYDPERQTMQYAASRGFRSTALQHAQLKLGEGYASRAVRERQTIHLPGLSEAGDEFAEVLQLAKEEFVDYYGMPLIVKDEVKGVLEIYHRSLLNPDLQSLGFLETLAGQAAIAVDNAQLFENLQRANAKLERRVAERTAELDQTNAELEHANRAKDAFLANMSHELRTPLNSILGLSESLREQHRGPLNESQQKFLQMIESSGRHLLELINDILDLSKIEAGMLEHHPQIIPVDDICMASLSFVKSQAVKKSITLTYTKETLVSFISADPRRLKQIIVNLLTNAVKFTPENGEVTLQVRTDPEKELIQFSILDTGIGIAPADLKHLFAPFVQVDSHLNRLNEGTGLGLSLVQKLTDLHGGSVEVESEVGKGSRFTVNLHCKPNIPEQFEDVYTDDPLRVAEEANGVPFQDTESITHRKILLVEDNAANILTIGDYLDTHGYEILVAHNGVEAIEKAQKFTPDVILMDIQMPVMDGLEATRRLRADTRFASTPIIALTALAMPGDRERCLEAGANEYMSKPVGMKALHQTLKNLLQTKPGG